MAAGYLSELHKIGFKQAVNALSELHSPEKGQGRAKKEHLIGGEELKVLLEIGRGAGRPFPVDPELGELLGGGVSSGRHQWPHNEEGDVRRLPDLQWNVLEIVMGEVVTCQRFVWSCGP
ncbi:hypothetical protein SAY87_019739 [Trapa incisa]|uniref:Uncharacterized protein n=1 Tax=Trapa incisa TaxID=236973 RepID=A0AAN7K686_9MYRT|nr:hypothetical protein SAY87_019739 [Trapa incisa]